MPALKILALCALLQATLAATSFAGPGEGGGNDGPPANNNLSNPYSDTVNDNAQNPPEERDAGNRSPSPLGQTREDYQREEQGI